VYAFFFVEYIWTCKTNDNCYLYLLWTNGESSNAAAHWCNKRWLNKIENKDELRFDVTLWYSITLRYFVLHADKKIKFFKLIYLRSLRNKLSQLILITLDRSFQMVSISLFERGLRGERSQTYPFMLSAKQGSIWYHFYNVFGMTRSGIELFIYFIYYTKFI